jgi:hypothetical protein
LGLQNLPPLWLVARLNVIYPENVPTAIWDAKLDGRQRAAGGPMNANEPYLVGEEGPEWVVPPRNSFVLPNGVTPMGGGGTSAGTPITISFAPTGDALFDAFLRELKKHVRISGGVQAALT